MTILNSKVTILLYDYYKKILYLNKAQQKSIKIVSAAKNPVATVKTPAKAFGSEKSTIVFAFCLVTECPLCKTIQNMNNLYSLQCTRKVILKTKH